MRKYYLFVFLFISLIIISCGTAKDLKEEAEISSPEIIEEIDQEPVDSDILDNDENSDDLTDIVEDYEEYVDTDDVEFIEEEVFPEDEYLRSIEEITTEDSITQQEFSDDKAAILQIISELSVIIEDNDVNSWLTYLDPESKKYYSNPANLRKAQRKLPNKLILLKTIKDYFENVFIPARKASKVDEIRYISKTEVKAVEVKEDNSIVVYYYFKKIKDKWYVNLPVV